MAGPASQKTSTDLNITTILSSFLWSRASIFEWIIIIGATVFRTTQPKLRKDQLNYIANILCRFNQLTNCIERCCLLCGQDKGTPKSMYLNTIRYKHVQMSPYKGSALCRTIKSTGLSCEGGGYVHPHNCNMSPSTNRITAFFSVPCYPSIPL